MSTDFSPSKSTVSVREAVAYAEVTRMVQGHMKVRYLDSGEDYAYPSDEAVERTAHLRGFTGDTADVTLTEVRMSDWMQEWTVPLRRLAYLKTVGALAIDRD